MATFRQIQAVNNLVENGGNVSRAMLEAGYSPATAKTPQKLTESAGFAELMEAYLPDDMLLGALSEDIEAKKGNRKAELELAFKLKGKMVEKQDVTSNGQAILVVPGAVAQAFNVGNTNTNSETGAVHTEQEPVQGS